MKTVKLTEVLEYYDGILLFTAQDPIGGNYLCEAVGTDGDDDRALERGRVVTVTGLLEQANRSTGEWALLTDDGIQSGRTYPGGPGLDGLRIGGSYRFECARVVRSDFLGQETQTLYLRQVEPA